MKIPGIKEGAKIVGEKVKKAATSGTAKKIGSDILAGAMWEAGSKMVEHVANWAGGGGSSSEENPAVQNIDNTAARAIEAESAKEDRKEKADELKQEKEYQRPPYEESRIKLKSEKNNYSEYKGKIERIKEDAEESSSESDSILEKYGIYGNLPGEHKLDSKRNEAEESEEILRKELDRSENRNDFPSASAETATAIPSFFGGSQVGTEESDNDEIKNAFIEKQINSDELGREQLDEVISLLKANNEILGTENENASADFDSELASLEYRSKSTNATLRGLEVKDNEFNSANFQEEINGDREESRLKTIANTISDASSRFQENNPGLGNAAKFMAALTALGFFSSLFDKKSERDTENYDYYTNENGDTYREKKNKHSIFRPFGGGEAGYDNWFTWSHSPEFVGSTAPRTAELKIDTDLFGGNQVENVNKRNRIVASNNPESINNPKYDRSFSMDENSRKEIEEYIRHKLGNQKNIGGTNISIPLVGGGKYGNYKIVEVDYNPVKFEMGPIQDPIEDKKVKTNYNELDKAQKNRANNKPISVDNHKVITNDYRTTNNITNVNIKSDSQKASEVTK